MIRAIAALLGTLLLGAALVAPAPFVGVIVGPLILVGLYAHHLGTPGRDARRRADRRRGYLL